MSSREVPLGDAAPSASLPFSDQIQAAFGRHDLSAVQAYTGGASAAASGAVGASAYATGSDIHFGAGDYAPTALGGASGLLGHEAAHVVQQRAGLFAGQY